MVISFRFQFVQTKKGCFLLFLFSKSLYLVSIKWDLKDYDLKISWIFVVFHFDDFLGSRILHHEVCPESFGPTFISPRHNVRATSAGHEGQP